MCSGRLTNVKIIRAGRCNSVHLTLRSQPHWRCRLMAKDTPASAPVSSTDTHRGRTAVHSGRGRKTTRRGQRAPSKPATPWRGRARLG